MLPGRHFKNKDLYKISDRTSNTTSILSLIQQPQDPEQPKHVPGNGNPFLKHLYF